MRSLPIAATALVLACACGGSRPPTEQPTLEFPDAAPPLPDGTPVAQTTTVDAAPSGPTEFTIPAQPLQVALTGKGKGKAAALRYAFATGAQIVDSTLDVGIDIAAGGKSQHQDAPTQTIGKTIEVVGVDANGTAMVATTMDRGSAADAGMTEAFEQLKSTRIEASVDARGRVGDVVIKSMAQDEGAARAVAGLIRFHTEAIVLPDEPVAIGATWTVTTHELINGIETDTITTYKLLKRSATSWMVKGTIASTAAAQTISAEALGGRPGSGTIDVKSMKGKGTVTVTIDPTRPAAVVEYEETDDALMAFNGQDVQVTSKQKYSQATRVK